MLISPRISIAICTRNRADSLELTIKSLQKMRAPEAWRLELLVIDNGSSDNTKKIVKEATPGCWELRYVWEPRKGQCWARNRALQESRGDVIIFTDDDVRVPPDWIERMCDPILRGEADAVAGGVIFPEHILKRLHELDLYRIRWWFASTDGLQADDPLRMVGANMAFHRRVLERVPGFDVELGPGALGFHDETLFARQLLNAGYRIAVALDVAVSHHFDISRFDRSGVLSLARRMGESDAYLQYHWSHTEIQRSTGQRFRMAVGLWLRRALHLYGRFKGGGVPYWEVDRVKDLAYAGQLCAEQGRPRNYDRYGLLKSNGAQYESAVQEEAFESQTNWNSDGHSAFVR